MLLRFLAVMVIIGGFESALLAQVSADHASTQERSIKPEFRKVPFSSGRQPTHLALVEGSDGCSTAELISGSGPFSFNNLSATTGAEGQANAACLFFGTTGIANDIWFTWTAGSTGSATIALCGGSSMDSKLAVYAGAGCPSGSPIACNDDSCALQSQASFAVTNGSQYTIQLGNFPTAVGSSGTFTINVVSTGTTNDDCSAASVISGPGPFLFDTSVATTGAEGQANANCLFYGTTGIANDIWFTWTAGFTGSATVALCGLSSMDSKLAVYAGAGCPSSSPIGCNDDSCVLQSQVLFSATSGNQYTIQLGSFPTATGGVGSFTINLSAQGAPCAALDDGSTEDALGLTAGGELCWMQRFGPLAQNTMVAQIFAAYGSPLNPPSGNPGNGTGVTVAIWSDPNGDGDPTDAVLLQTVAGVISGSGTDAFQTFTLSSPLPINGFFFVGADIANPVGQFPAPLDHSSNPAALGAAWVFGSTSGPTDLYNLGANDIPPISLASAGFPGQWLLRINCANCLDTDGDGTPDCTDGCPYDPMKIEPGPCGCGVAAPTITTSPHGQSVAVGSFVQLTTVAGGYPLNYQWRHNGVAIPGATTSTYSFFAHPANAGPYDCVVSNTCATAVTAIANVVVTIFGWPVLGGNHYVMVGAPIPCEEEWGFEPGPLFGLPGQISPGWYALKGTWSGPFTVVQASTVPVTLMSPGIDLLSSDHEHYLATVPCQGGTRALKIGDTQVTDCGPCEGDAFGARKYFTVTDTHVYYRYALVVQDAHCVVDEEPYFDLSIKRQSTDEVVYNEHVHMDGSTSGFIEIDPKHCPTPYVAYLDWQCRDADLSAYVGESLYVDVVVTDCFFNPHWGYGYIDFLCANTCDIGFSITIPNVFTPNGDGINDYWGPIQMHNVFALKIEVFDRWGNRVFHAQPVPTVGSTFDPSLLLWNGTNNGNGSPLPDGTYYYVVKASGCDVTQTFSGTVNIFH